MHNTADIQNTITKGFYQTNTGDYTTVVTGQQTSQIYNTNITHVIHFWKPLKVSMDVSFYFGCKRSFDFWCQRSQDVNKGQK